MRRFLPSWRGLYKLFFFPPRRNASRPKHLPTALRGRVELLRLEDRTLPSVFGNFQVDGDLQALVNPAPGAYDWDTLGAVTSSVLPKLDTIQNDAFNSANDDQFASGAKESDPMRFVALGSSPSKADITRMYVGHNAIPNPANPNGNDVYLYLGFNRFTNTGDTFNGFELNQSPVENNYNAGNGYVLPRRTAGDLLITFDFNSGSVQIGLLKWTGNDTAGNWVNPSTSAVGVPLDLTSSGYAMGAVNSGTINNAFPATGFPTTFAAQTFGEAAINLSQALGFNSGATFHQVYMSTRSSSGYNSSLKDVVKPFNIVVPLKGDVSGTKFEDLNANGIQDPGENPLPGWTFQLLDTSNNVIKTTTADSAGFYDFPGLPIGTYKVREVLQGTFVQKALAPINQLPSGVTEEATANASLYGAQQYSATVLGGIAETGLNFGNRLEGDLSITKTDNKTGIMVGTTTTYTITVSNSGPSTATGAMIADNLPAGAGSGNWTVTATTGGATVTGPTSGGNNLSTTATLPANSSVTFSYTALVTSKGSGTLTNTATVTAGGTFVDTNPANNSAKDVDSIGKADASIQITPYNVIYDGSAHVATGTATGAAGVDLSAYLTLTSTTHINAGSYTDSWSFHDPNGNYNDASGTITDVITAKLASVTPDAKSKVYGSADPVLTGVLSGFLAGDNVTATYSRTSGETVLGGPYTISASLSPSPVLSNYRITYNTAAFPITPMAATWTTNDNSKVYGTGDPSPLTTGSGSGFLTSDGVTASYSRVLGETVGTYPVTAVLDSSVSGALSNYSITNPGATFTITPASVNVVWSNPEDITYGTPLGPTQLNATANVPGSFVYLPGAGTVLNAGPHQALTVQFTPADTTDFSIPAPVTVFITVSKAQLTVTANDQSKTYDGSVFSPFTATITGFVNGDTLSAVSGSPDFTGSAVGAVHAGSYGIKPTIGSLAAANYNFTFQDGTLTIQKADATINVTGYSVVYDGNAHTTSGTVTGAGGVDLSGDLVLTGTTHTNAGTYSGDGWSFHDPNGNYNDASGTVNDLIKKANPNVSVLGYTVSYDGSAHTATGTATGAGSVDLRGCLILTDTTHANAGTYSDTWSFHDPNGNYNDASGPVTDTIHSVLAVFAGGNVTLDAGDSWSRNNKSFTDSPGATRWTVTVNYGDGTGDQTLESNGTSTTFNLSHTWTTPGIYVVWVTVTDDLGTTMAVSFTVTVNPLS
jgi:uncharacterized repeat protein (TIGR01451 family)